MVTTVKWMILFVRIPKYHRKTSVQVRFSIVMRSFGSRLKFVISNMLRKRVEKLNLQEAKRKAHIIECHESMNNVKSDSDETNKKAISIISKKRLLKNIISIIRLTKKQKKQFLLVWLELLIFFLGRVCRETGI